MLGNFQEPAIVRFYSQNDTRAGGGGVTGNERPPAATTPAPPFLFAAAGHEAEFSSRRLGNF